MQTYYNLIKKKNGGGAGRFETRIKSIVQLNKKIWGVRVCEPRIEGIVQFIKNTNGVGVGVNQELKVLKGVPVGVEEGPGEMSTNNHLRLKEHQKFKDIVQLKKPGRAIFQPQKLSSYLTK